MPKRFAHPERFMAQEFSSAASDVERLRSVVFLAEQRVAKIEGILSGGQSGEFLQTQAPTGPVPRFQQFGWSTPTSLPVVDTTAIVKGSSDATKQLRMEVDGQAAGVTGVLAATFSTNETLTLPDATDVLVGRNTTDTLTNKTIDTASNSVTIDEADITDLQPYLLSIVEDITPQLGGNLDSNGFNIDLGDNERLRLGDSNDASIYFTGTNLIINPGFSGGIIDTQDTDMKTGHIGVGATPSSFLLLNIFRSSTTITTAINGTVIATGAQNQITGLNFSAKWGGTGSVATPVGSLSQSSLAANMPSFGLATVVGADATAGINIAQTNPGSIYTLYGIRGAVTTVTTHTAHTFTCASIYGKAIPSFGASATVVGWAGLFDDDVQITADNKLLFDGDTQIKGDTYMVFDSVNNTLDTFINNTEEINLSANQLEFVGGTSRALGWSTSGQLDFKINNASEMRLAANTLTFEAGATDVALDWSTSGQLAFKIGLTNEMRLTANTLTFEAGFSDVSIGWATSGKMDITGNMDCSGYMDAALGFKDNGVQGIDGSFADRTGKIVTVSGGIITSIV